MSAAEAMQSPLDRPLSVTFFTSFAASEKREQTITLRALVPKIQSTTHTLKVKLPWLKLASFGDLRNPKEGVPVDRQSLRHDRNVLTISGIEVDYDREIVTVDEAVAILRRAGLASMVYTSPSHTADTPRWRVLCPLSRDAEPSARAGLVGRLNGLFHGALSNESFALSQSYYYGSLKNNPSHHIALTDGAYLDDRADLDEGAIGKPRTEYTPAETPATTRTENKSKFVEAVIRNALSKVRGAIEGQKHHTLRNQAILLGGYQHAGNYTASEAVEWLMAALSDTAKDRKAAATTALWGFEQGASKPIAIPDLPPRAQRPSPPPQDSETQDYADADNVVPFPSDPPIEDDPNYLAAIADEIDRSPAESVIAEFNRRYMVVNEAGKAVIYAPAYDPVLKRQRFDRMAFEDLKRLYLNRRIKVGEDEKGKAVMRGAADHWLTSPDRKQYINGVTFDPSDRAQDDGILNLWKGFAAKPAPGDWSLMRDHIKFVICKNDHERFDYLINWLARMLQQPDTQGETAIVLKGGEGTGKGTLAKALLYIIGHHSLAISNSKHLTGNFNSHLRDCVFLFADEAFFAGDKSSIGSLKSLITEPYLTVEAKYQNAVQIPNFLHILMASNEEWVVPASLDARRFFVLEVPDDKKNAHGYFAAIAAQMKAGGYEAMLHDLLTLDLSEFNVRDVPITEGLQRQKKLSLGTTDAWWMDVLHRGYVLQSKCGLGEMFGEWREEVTTELLYASYSAFATSRHERHPLSRETLGRELRRFGAKPKKLFRAVVGEHITDVDTGFGSSARKGAVIRSEKPYGYQFGDLHAAREAFANSTLLPVDWGDEDE